MTIAENNHQLSKLNMIKEEEKNHLDTFLQKEIPLKQLFKKLDKVDILSNSLKNLRMVMMQV